MPPAEHQFKPGQSGNPRGRPKGLSLTKRIRRLLRESELEGVTNPAGLPLADLLIASLVRGAIKGNFKQQKEILDRVEGKVADRVKQEISGPGGDAVQVHFFIPENGRDPADQHQGD